MSESSKETIEGMCPKKKRGHRCIIKKNLTHEVHRCFCKEMWEEVKT